MAEFTVNPGRIDPYRISRFQVILDNSVIPGVSRISGLKHTTEVVEHRDGVALSTLHSSPGVTTFEPILLERGLTHDTTFEDWAEQCFNRHDNMSLAHFRKDMRIDLLNQQGNTVLSYMVYRCWVSEYQALPDLDANENEVAIESILIQHEGFERDRAVTEPQET